jgi:hypothetical protein
MDVPRNLDNNEMEVSDSKDEKCSASAPTTEALPSMPRQQNGISQEASSECGTYNDLLKRITSMEEENRHMKKAVEEKQEEPKWLTLYYLKPEPQLPTVAYLDAPSWSAGPAEEFSLKAHLPVTDIDGFLKQKKDTAFVVSKFYSPSTQMKDVQAAYQEKRPLQTPQPSSEYIRFKSKAMITAIQSFVDKIPDFGDKFPAFKIEGSISAPYLFWYRYGWRSPEAISGLQEPQRSLLQLWSRWIDEQYGELYDRVTKQLENGVISQDTMPFLVEPGDVIIWEDKGKLHAVVAQSSPKALPRPTLTRRKSDLQNEEDESMNTDDRVKYDLVWYVRGWRYEYDGNFYWTNDRHMYMTLKAEALDEEVKIQSLGAYPLMHADERSRIALETRGKRYWSCRYQDVVSYEDESGLYGVRWNNLRSLFGKIAEALHRQVKDSS